MNIQHPFFCLLAVPNNEGCLRLGVVVSKRVATSAVIRNRIKRQVRAFFRLRVLANYSHIAFDVVVIARKNLAPDKQKKTLAEKCRHNLLALFNQLIKKKF